MGIQRYYDGARARLFNCHMYKAASLKGADLEECVDLQKRAFNDPNRSSGYSEEKMGQLIRHCRNGDAHGTVVRAANGDMAGVMVSGDKRLQKYDGPHFLKRRKNGERPAAGTIRTIAMTAVDERHQRRKLCSLMLNKHVVYEGESETVRKHGGVLKIRSENEGARKLYETVFDEGFRPGVKPDGDCSWQEKSEKQLTCEVVRQAKDRFERMQAASGTRLTYSTRERLRIIARHPRYANYYVIKLLAKSKRAYRKARSAF